jgi:hypothetical protein
MGLILMIMIRMGGDMDGGCRRRRTGMGVVVEWEMLVG